MEIHVLVENSSANENIKGRHGLSLLIKTDNKSILYDFGPKNSLSKNADNLSVSLEDIDFAVLSHNHIDHGGDINNFCRLNNKAKIHVNTNLSERLYTKLFSFIKFPIGIKLNPEYRNRIIEDNNSDEIAENIYLLRLSDYISKSTLNIDLFIKKNNGYENDTFQHESALVIKDYNELVIFCACSHHGVSNIIDDAEKKFPGHKIKAFVGGFHMCNPVSKKNESEIYIRNEIERLKEKNIVYYTGHCTGDYAFSLFKSELKNKINKISTGMIISI